MSALKTPRPTYSSITSTLALIVALSGGAYAVTVLPKNSVGAKELKKNSVSAVKVKDGSLTGADLAAGTITARELSPGVIPKASGGGRADSAATADKAATATLADKALSALSADKATSATSAERATSATSADRATTAGRADSAATADKATSATSADSAANASALGGLAASEYERSGRLRTVWVPFSATPGTVFYKDAETGIALRRAPNTGPTGVELVNQDPTAVLVADTLMLLHGGNNNPPTGGSYQVRLGPGQATVPLTNTLNPSRIDWTVVRFVNSAATHLVNVRCVWTDVSLGAGIGAGYSCSFQR